MAQTIRSDKFGWPCLHFLGGVELRVETEELSEEFLKKAQVELRETPEIVERGLQELRELLKADKELFIPTDREFLIRFLRPCKFYAKSAYDLIHRYYQFKVKNGTLCANLTPKSLRHVFESGLIFTLPRRDQHGRRILIVQCGKLWNPAKVSVVDFFRAMQMCVEGGMVEPATQANGIVAILDMEGLSWTHIRQLNPSFAFTSIEWVQKRIPVRLKALHVVNNSKIANLLFQIFRPFADAKFRNRTLFHGSNLKSVHSHIDPCYLTPRYGGTLELGQINNKTIADMLELFNEEFEVYETFGYGKSSKVVYDGMFRQSTEKFRKRYSTDCIAVSC